MTCQTPNDPQGTFASSDSLRAAGPLRHAQQVTFDQPLPLEHGEVLPGVTVVYETYGQLSAQRDNAILICHAISGDSHVARHDPDDQPGWWDAVVGPGKAIDTDRYFVICPNILGGCRGSTGPNSLNPATGKPWGGDFPTITIGDMVQVQRRLIDHLGIGRLRAVVGGSLGGMQVLQWARAHGDRLAGAVAVATTPRLTSQALAFDVVARNAILHDPNYHHGHYYDKPGGPSIGLALARMLGHITYLSREGMVTRFDVGRQNPRDVATHFEKRFNVGSYLAYQGHKFVERFDANSYMTLSLAMDLFDAGGDQASLEQSFANADCRWLVLSFSSDWLFPPFQSRQLAHALVARDKQVSYCNVQSECGHDAFLLEDDLLVYGRMIGGFLDRCSTEAAVSDTSSGSDPRLADPTSIYHNHRLDYQHILSLVPSGASVLDVGCGNGELLSLLAQRGHRQVMGGELDEDLIARCIERGLDVVQVDLANDGLAGFGDQRFDVVILSQTLQSIPNTEQVISDVVRVGRRCIISFPNFAYGPLREMLYREGRSPKTQGVYPYEWYNTPNRRFPSILDVQSFCQDMGLRIDQQVYLDTQAGRQVQHDPNRHADMAIFVISR